jgi:bacterioferritin (cytochrome b1)
MYLTAITMQVERMFTELLKGKERHASFMDEFLKNLEAISIPKSKQDSLTYEL